ncbi:MAG TPA: prepilin-type N-terminal cleavage/methylation domain-containing protein, partial [Nitrospirae bacterium]|nr:prepilin-type N-terminal cleavage/methylation domain-containing protein [Nitrospirota bacterium]
MKRTDSTGGFTLLELVIALSITSLILVFIGSAFYMGYRSEERASEREGLQQRIRIINERLTWLLRGAYPFVRVSPEGNTLYFFGKKDSIGFVTTSTLSGSALEERAGLTFMKIFLDDG